MQRQRLLPPLLLLGLALCLVGVFLYFVLAHVCRIDKVDPKRLQLELRLQNLVLGKPCVEIRGFAETVLKTKGEIQVEDTTDRIRLESAWQEEKGPPTHQDRWTIDLLTAGNGGCKVEARKMSRWRANDSPFITNRQPELELRVLRRADNELVDRIVEEAK